jgi:hypothetical protein
MKPQQRQDIRQPLDSSIRLIPLTQGQVAVVDVVDYEWLAQWRWFAVWSRKTKSFYASRHLSVSEDRSRAVIQMHREIVKAVRGPESILGIDVDHRNHNTLDNKRENLRPATRSQNQHNSRTRKDNTSGFKGVSQYGVNGKWRSYLSVGGRTIGLGVFDTAGGAAEARRTAEIEHHGEFAVS